MCSSRSRLRVVAKQDAGVPPAWDRRVVVPHVQARDTPKASLGQGMVAGKLIRASTAPL